MSGIEWDTDDGFRIEKNHYLRSARPPYHQDRFWSGFARGFVRAVFVVGAMIFSWWAVEITAELKIIDDVAFYGLLLSGLIGGAMRVRP